MQSPAGFMNNTESLK